MEKKEYILWGGTGQSIVIEEIIGLQNGSVVALFDNNSDLKNPFLNIPLFIGEDGFETWYASNYRVNLHFVVCIGGGRGSDRVYLSKKLKNLGFHPSMIIHPEAYISPSSQIGAGIQALAGSVVSSRCKIDDYCILNTNSTIDHESELSEGVHIGPGATLAGNVKVGKNSFVGTNATILPNIIIGENCTIGAGSVVTKNVLNNSVVCGNPAKVRHSI